MITNLYPNLPGHLVEFKDGGLTSIPDSEEVNSGKSLLITGTALDGPVMEPVQVSADTVESVFGSDVDENGYPNGTTLTKYAKQAFRNGFTDVRCMRVTGTQASVEVSKTAQVIEEQKNGTPISVSIPGNKAMVFKLKALPFIGTPSIYYKKSPTDTSTDLETNLNAYVGENPINKNTLNASSIIGVREYQYMKFGATKTITETAADDTEVTITIPNSDTDGHIYKTPNDAFTTDSLGNDIMRSYTINGETNAVPDTTGTVDATYSNGYPKVTVNDTTLVLANNEYSVTENIDGTMTITVPSSKLNASEQDTIVVSYEAYDVVSYTQEEETVESNFIDEANSSNTIVINHEDINTVTVLVKHAGSQEYEAVLDGTTVANTEDGKKSVTFDVTKFSLSDNVKIDWTYIEKTNIMDTFLLRATNGGSKYNGSLSNGVSLLKITELTDSDNEVIGKRFTFVKPADMIISSSDKPFYFDSTKVPTLGLLRDELRKYAFNNMFEIITDDDEIRTADFPVGEYYLTGGTDGINPTNNEMYEALAGKRWTQDDVANGDCTASEVGYLKEQGAYQILENYHVDFVYSAGIYADSVQTVNPNSSFHNELALLCAVLTYRTKMTHGFIDVKPNSNTTLKGVQKYVENLLTYNNVHYMKDYDGTILTDSDGKYMDIGWYTSLVVGPEVIMSSDTLGTYYGSPAIAYAALCGQIAPQSAPTNKQVPGCTGLKYKLSNRQMDSLTANHMVTFKIKNEGVTASSSVPYVVDGCTCGSTNCDYQRISTVKIVSDVIDQIREVADPYIGEANVVEQRNALSAQISKRLSALMETGEILNYEFTIIATQYQVLIGECSIELTLSVPMELRTIKTTVGLTPAV